MGTTTGDNLRYPVLADPANVPQDMMELATDVQAGLNKRAAIIPTQQSISRAAGWSNNFPQAIKTGKIVVLSSHFQRNTALAAAASEDVPLGTLPAGFRPAAVERFPVMFSDNGVRKVGSTVQVAGDGSITWRPTGAVNLAIDDYVSVSGVVFMIP